MPHLTRWESNLPAAPTLYLCLIARDEAIRAYWRGRRA